MATTRFDMRLNKKVKLKAEKAATLLGLKSLTEYVSKLMDEDSTRVIKQHETMIVDDNVFDRFFDACNKVTTPNDALKSALTFTKNSGIK